MGNTTTQTPQVSKHTARTVAARLKSAGLRALVLAGTIDATEDMQEGRASLVLQISIEEAQDAVLDLCKALDITATIEDPR